MADNSKKKIIDNSTKVGSEFLQPIFGGDSSYPATDPRSSGHIHDLEIGSSASGTWGHCAKIDLTSNTTNRLVLADAYSVIKSTSLTNSAATQVSGGLVWYFWLPTDIDLTKTTYFSFAWMGSSADNSNNITNTTFQSTTFQITWQWYSPNYSILAPATIYDGQPPANQVGSNINQNSLSRGRTNLTVNAAPFQMFVNDSSTNSPNYIELTGINQVTNPIMIGIQVNTLNTGFVGGVSLFSGNLFYLSKTLGSSNIKLPTF